ncbi:MAG: lysylphosphatidylglycerol synthase transmembrane domain-containing protein [Candidatus Peribacteraceae bacterium]|jgi:hypothetical protein|nr:lysylphosphatidylglycerol synthase transmembrane domain-containing protein [Candidatus Peribacteraceae bacterium]|tara:strand:- start:2890 stop:3744 length:855 start_codon:yes stop_codon:yes gene_type:complete
MRNTLLRYGLKLIGVLLFILILTQIDRAQMLQVLANISIAHLAVMFLLFPVTYAIKSYRWHILTRHAGKEVHFVESFLVYCSGLFFGIVTPGRIGELIKVPALTTRGVPTQSAVILTIFERIIDAMFMGVIGIAAIGILWSWALAGAIAACGAMILCIGIALKNPLLRFIPTVQSTLAQWPTLLSLTFIAWVIYFLQLIILQRGFGFSVPILPFISIMTIAGIVAMMPIAPAGLGTRDAVVALLFSSFAVPTETSIAFTATIFFLTIVASSIGLVAWMYSPKHV